MSWTPSKFANEPPETPLWDYHLATDTFKYLTREDVERYECERAAYWMLHHAIPALMKLAQQIAAGEADYRFSPAKMIATGRTGYTKLVDAGLIQDVIHV
jgi:hypothetical protein